MCFVRHPSQRVSRYYRNVLKMCPDTIVRVAFRKNSSDPIRIKNSLIKQYWSSKSSGVLNISMVVTWPTNDQTLADFQSNNMIVRVTLKRGTLYRVTDISNTVWPNDYLCSVKENRHSWIRCCMLPSQPASWLRAHSMRSNCFDTNTEISALLGYCLTSGDQSSQSKYGPISSTVV